MAQEPTPDLSEPDVEHSWHLPPEPVSARTRRTQPEPPLLVTVEEAARRLSIGRTAAYLLVLRGDLQSVKIGRMRRVVAASLEAYIQRLLEQH